MPKYARTRTSKRFKPYRAARKLNFGTTAIKARRTIRRKKRYSRAKVPFKLYSGLVQKKLRTSIRYVDTKLLAPGTGVDSHIYHLNNIYDPQVAFGGHQPAFYAQWNVLYTNYRVISAKYKVSFRPAADTTSTDKIINQWASGGTAAGETHAVNEGYTSHIAGYNHIVFLEATDKATSTATEATDKNFLRETARKIPNLSWRYMKGLDATVSIKGKAAIGRLLNAPSEANLDYGFTSGPAAGDTAYLHIGSMSKDGTYAFPVKIDITIDYIVELTNPTNIGQSG